MPKETRHTNTSEKVLKGNPSSNTKMLSSNEKKSMNELAPTLKKLFKYIGKYKNIMVIGLILAAAGSILMMLGPNLVGNMTNMIKDGLGGTIDIQGISNIGIILVALYLTSAAFTFIQHYIMAGMTAKICKKVRQEFAEKINKVPQSYYNTHIHGDILSCITNDVQTLRQGLSRSIPNIVRSLAQFLTCLLLMFVTEWRLTLCVVLIVFVSLIIIMIIMKKSQKYFDQRQQNLGVLNGYIEEMYTGHKIVKMTLAQKSVIEKFKEKNLKLYKTDYMSQFLSGIMAPIMTIIGNLSILGVVVLGSFLVLSGQIEFGVIIAFILFTGFFTSPLTRLAQCMTDIQGIAAASMRIFNFFEAKEFANESHKTKSIKTPKGKVSFKHVKFSYPSSPDKIIIKDFNAEIEPGQKVAIVGKTGAGKTTLVNLLMRFYEVNSGSIEIDGENIWNLKRENIHNLFGMVLQDTWLFESSIRENLIYNIEGITEDRLIEVCKVCGIYDFICDMPDGFETIITENLAISAGQKQLFTIARAMLQDRPMFILDEATSSIDSKTELDIQIAMDKLTKNRTSFVIAHRLSTIKNANIIFVMDSGDIVEQGTHQELLQKKGYYYELYNSQFQD